ncbi:MAG TPA: cytochrome c oxidase assembly protein [Candidatus Saccharimonadales bacterium]|nr:cytochrome c oxidase assembly protein [Candidatus Saccharimonadales bacterium]
MLHIHHTVAMGLSSSSSPTILFALVPMSFLYVHSWRRMQRDSSSAISGWRLASFLFGMSLIWAAIGSPLVAYEHDLLTVHMIQHLLLMTFAPALILLGEPLVAFWHGLPQFAKVVLGPLFRWPLAQRFGRALSRPAFCGIVSALTLMGWHVPALFTWGMHSEVWHSVEQASFLVAGFLFWWPVIQPWPTASTGPQWSTLLYLFLATLPCDILSGFLVFSDRVAYPMYFSMPRHFGFSVLEDQQCAAALMWTCVTIVYLVPAAILSTQLLSPRSFCRRDLVPSELSGSATSQTDSHRLEIV